MLTVPQITHKDLIEGMLSFKLILDRTIVLENPSTVGNDVGKIIGDQVGVRAGLAREIKVSIGSVAGENPRSLLQRLIHTVRPTPLTFGKSRNIQLV